MINYKSLRESKEREKERKWERERERDVQVVDSILHIQLVFTLEIWIKY